ncbi:serine hydrolase domain-containing protein [Oryzihumus sp.]|uniref:serine hydrolase domain-containing protein n=1 Tax=Oryzihumus sp. TaxID=1968903 RepID=UPI002EDAF7FD
MERRNGPAWTRVRLTRLVIAAALALGVAAVPMVATGAPQAVLARVTGASSACDRSCLAGELRADLQGYLQKYGTAEHISAGALSVSLRGRRDSIDVAAGTTRFGGSRAVDSDSVWQIGSNTKAFTSVLLLQLEAEHRLSINDTLGRWLPQYPQWRGVTIKRLLNMTSGIPNYTEQAPLLAEYVAHPHRYVSVRHLVSSVVGVAPTTTSYHYSNTNYVLAEMVIEKATGHSYQRELYSRLIRPLHLRDLWYRTDVYPRSVTAREPAGYYFSDQPSVLAPIRGRDVSRDTLSWARGAGGIISTTADMIRWERALYRGQVLPRAQQAELLSLISTRTGKPIASTSPSDPSGFGLGVAQATFTGFGTVWLYEGGTLGFRTLHVWFPKSDLLVAMGLNSAPTQDHIEELAIAAYKTVVAHGLTTPAAAS